MARYDSSSDDSDDHQHLLAESLLDKKKREIVAKSMAIFNQWLDNKLGKRARDDQESSGEESVPRARDAARKKQKRHSTRPPPPPVEDDDAASEVGVGVGVGAGSAGRKFACPYYKHNHAKYKSVKTCMGPGWASVHRVKEHVYRSHALPKHCCPRCLEPFANEAKLKSHQRTEKSCKLKTEGLPDGFDQAMESRLRERVPSKSTEEEKWTLMFEILFPGAPAPSPYYDDVNTIESVGEEMKSIQDDEEMRRFLQRMLPPIAQKMIEAEVERQFKTLNDVMVAKSAEICESIQTQLVRTWAYQKEQAGGTAAGVVDTPYGPRTPTSVRAAEEADPSPPPPPPLDYPTLESIQYPFLMHMNNSTFPFESFLTADTASFCALSTNTGPTQDSAYYTSSEAFNPNAGSAGLP